MEDKKQVEWLSLIHDTIEAFEKLKQSWGIAAVHLGPGSQPAPANFKVEYGRLRDDFDIKFATADAFLRTHWPEAPRAH